jgi:glucans biosynthesis protein C
MIFASNGPNQAPNNAPSIALLRERLFFLDWLRILAFGALVLYHVGMYFVTWDFHVKSPFSEVSGKALEPWMKLTEPWRMSLIFMISGAATALMLHRGLSFALVRSRSRFLLLPLLCGIVFIIPPQSYFEVVQKFNYPGSYVDFLGLYFSGYKGFCSSGQSASCLILPTWNHLWFLPYLWAYTMVICAVLACWPEALKSVARRCDKWANGLYLLLIPIALLYVIRLFLKARFPVTHALFGDWFSHAVYFSMFAIGAMFATSKDAWGELAALRWVAFISAGSCWAILVFAPPAKLLNHLFVATFQWCAIAAAFGFAFKHLNRDSRFRATLAEAVFPVYVLHQTIIIVGSQWLLPLRLTPYIEAGALVMGTLIISYAGYALLRRFDMMRPWFGMKRRN